MTKSWLSSRYILFELLPTFFLGLIIFLFIIVMFQAFRLMEYILVHGASLKLIMQILGFLSLGFLPVILPMSLLFSIIMVYGRMSADSEVVAFKALGLNTHQIAYPAFFLAILVSLLSSQISFNLAPWGQEQKEIILAKLAQTRPTASIREGVFSEGFFDLVVYANEVDSKTDTLKKVFIYDEREKDAPVTIIAKQGQLITSSSMEGNKAFLRLINGNIHKSTNEVYTKIDFDNFDINLFDPAKQTAKGKSHRSHNQQELKYLINNRPKNISDKNYRKLKIEFNRRWAISLASLLFALVGVALSIQPNRRSTKSSGFVLCLGLAIFYWIGYAVFYNWAKNDLMPAWISMWAPNMMFLIFGLRAYIKAR